MSLRAQLAVLTGILVAATVIVVSLVAYYATKDRLRTQVDNTLVSRSEQVGDAAALPGRGPGEGGPGGQGENAPDPFGATDVYFQVIDKRGAIVRAPAGQQKTIDVERQRHRRRERDAATPSCTTGRPPTVSTCAC